MKTIAYLRVSTEAQDLEKNKLEIEVFCKARSIVPEYIEEKISGTIDFKDRKLAGILDSLKKGDNLIVSELSRLGRSTLQILQILDIARKKGINVFAIKGNWQLDNTMQSKIVSTMFAMLAEIERDLISERTREALRARAEAGVKLGRPVGYSSSGLDAHSEKLLKLRAEGYSCKAIGTELGYSAASVSLWLRKHHS